MKRYQILNKDQKTYLYCHNCGYENYYYSDIQKMYCPHCDTKYRKEDLINEDELLGGKILNIITAIAIGVSFVFGVMQNNIKPEKRTSRKKAKKYVI